MKKWVVYLLAAGLISIQSHASGQALPLEQALDGDLAGFVLKNTPQLRLEIRTGEGARLQSLTSELKLGDNPETYKCLQGIEADARKSSYQLYLELTKLHSRETDIGACQVLQKRERSRQKTDRWHPQEKLSDEGACQLPPGYPQPLQNESLKNISARQCGQLIVFLEAMRSDHIALLIASPSADTPMSYFGHTALVFLREDDLYFSRSVSFLAAEETAGMDLSLMLRGALGQIDGVYTINPLHQLINKYIEQDQRNIKLFPLTLTEEEKLLITLQIFENREKTYPYNFFFNNCTTRLMDVLTTADPNLKNPFLIESVVSPDSLLSSLKDRQMVTTGVRLDAQVPQLFEAYWEAPKAERRSLEKFLIDEDKARQLNAGEDSGVSPWMISMAQNIYRVQFKAYGAPPADYGIVANAEPSPPIKALKHDVKPEKRRPRRITMDAGLGSEQSVFLGYSPGLYDRQTKPQRGVIESSIRYLSMEGSLDERGHSQLESLQLIEASSLHKRSVISRPRSWSFEIGADRSFDDDNIDARIMASRGWSWGRPSTLVFALPSISAYGSHGIFPGLNWGASMDKESFRLSIEGQTPIEINARKPLETAEVEALYRFNQLLAFRTSWDLHQKEGRAGLLFSF